MPGSSIFIPYSPFSSTYTFPKPNLRNNDRLVTIKHVRSFRLTCNVLLEGLKLKFVTNKNSNSKINIGTAESPLIVSKMGCGTWNWGNQVLWGYDTDQDEDLEKVFNFCLDSGVNLFDTGDSYGTGKLEGRAEVLLGEFSSRRAGASSLCVASKLAAYPWRLTPGSMVKAIEASSQRLGRPLEMAQMHWDPSSYGAGFQESALVEGLCQAYESGLVRAVGLSNFGPRALRQVHRRMETRGVPIATLQTQFSLLSYLDYQRETKEVCDELGITLISYSPLCLGLLSGKYSSEGKGTYPEGPRGLLARRLLPGAESSGLLPILKEIAKRKKVTTSQVTLAWNMAKDTIPIPGAKNLDQCKQNIKAMSVNLSSSEVASLDEAAMRIKTPMLQNSMRSM